MDADHVVLARAVAAYGMGTTLEAMSENERKLLVRQMKRILQEHAGVSYLVEVVRYGMPDVWPISEEGYFDGDRVTKHISKAKAVYHKKLAMGIVPRKIGEVEREFERMRREVEGREVGG